MACETAREKDIGYAGFFGSFARIFAERTRSHVYALPDVFNIMHAMLRNCQAIKQQDQSRQGVAHGIELLYSGSKGKRTIRVFLPEKASRTAVVFPCHVTSEEVNQFKSERDAYVFERANANPYELSPCLNLSNAVPLPNCMEPLARSSVASDPVSTSLTPIPNPFPAPLAALLLPKHSLNAPLGAPFLPNTLNAPPAAPLLPNPR